MNPVQQAAIRSGNEQAAQYTPPLPLCAYCHAAGQVVVWWRWPNEETLRRTAVCERCQTYPEINGVVVAAVEVRR